MRRRLIVHRAKWLGALIVAACAGAPQDPVVAGACQDPAALADWARATAAIAAGDDAGAVASARAVVERCPGFVRAHIAFQDAAARCGGETAVAMTGFYERLADDGTAVPAYCKARLLPTAYAQNAALAELVGKYPKFAWARLSQARLARGQGRALAAIDAYTAALRAEPELWEACLERAQALGDLGRGREAVVDFRAYLAARPDDLAANRAFVRLLLYDLGRTKEALPYLQRVEASLPDDPDVRMDRAAACWRLGQYEQSAEAYVAALRARPQATGAALNLGLLYYEVVPRDEAARRRFWPVARAAFRHFLDGPATADGVEQYERALGVPFRMGRIAALLGPEPPVPARIDELRWPAID
ncbi:MAG: tetratricopeptide repeat protein [Planctomycetes bacterium]|nr:tetratricopeptide repeat protein [Planctomycetota bacterium]